jgi:hypothetical protein
VLPILAFLRAPDSRIGVDRDDVRRRRIRCPQCHWEPSRHDAWRCSPGCGHVWNTFDTAGRCPGCSTQWTSTACLRCHVWSAHDDWYVDE